VLYNIALIVGICLVVSKIIANETYNYRWFDILVIYCHFCTSYIYMDSHYLELSSATYFVKISQLVVEVQAE